MAQEKKPKPISPPPPPPPEFYDAPPPPYYLPPLLQDSRITWMILGAVFGFVGILVAAATDKGGGRTNAAAFGCLINALIFLTPLAACVILPTLVW